MINNVILKRVSNILDFNHEQICAVFTLGGCEISTDQLTQVFDEKNEPNYKALTDIELASFLNGLIVEKRGPNDGPTRATEVILNNNIIFNKLKIALALKADDVIEILALGKITLGKYELSSFFRNVNHKHYKECSDEVLLAFLSGLKAKKESS